MSEMVERATQAMLSELRRQANDDTSYVSDGGDMERVTLDGIFDLLAAVRAAIEAMREPTADMLAAFTNATVNEWATTSGQIRGFSAMIDAALAE